MERPRLVSQLLLALALLCACLAAQPLAAAEAYTQQENFIFAETDGICVAMDIFRPTGTPNGLAVVDIASGAWHSDRGKIRDHQRAQMFDIICGRGYHVFAVRPGSVTKFSALEMVDHVKQAIRWVKAHAEEFQIDPHRLGLCGASAGGHLTCLTAVTADDGQPDSKDPLARQSSRVAACIAFFPPTDFIAWAERMKVDPTRRPTGRFGDMMGGLLFPRGFQQQSPEEITAQMEKISPARLVTSQCPPILLLHGDADLVVPLEQSKIMLAALQQAGVTTELIIKKGGGHPWPTIHEEVKIAMDWAERLLVANAQPAAAPLAAPVALPVAEPAAVGAGN